jgi:hypothetical protein
MKGGMTKIVLTGGFVIKKSNKQFVHYVLTNLEDVIFHSSALKRFCERDN